LIRSAFIAEEGQLWWAKDWSQIEYRLIAHYASITRYRGRLLEGAAEVVHRYNTDPDIDYHMLVAELTGLSRSNAKNLNFGLAYGQGIDLLCANLGVSREEGMRIITEYHKRAPFVRPLMSAVSDRANELGFIRTMLGRRRNFDTWERRGKDGEMEYSPEWQPGFRRAFLHKALNALIQGSAADLMKKAMVEYWESGVMDVLGVPHLTVHDELDGSMPDTPIGWEAFHEVSYIMENCVKIKVPIMADSGTGTNWAEAKSKGAYDGRNHRTKTYSFH
jgi:DNA polymerase-1